MVSPIQYTGCCAMQNPRVVSELLQQHNNRLKRLGDRLKERATVLDVVQRNLPARLATSVASAGLDQGRLTLGVRGGAWASRLRYQTCALRAAVASALGTEVISVRIRVLPPQDGA